MSASVRVRQSRGSYIQERARQNRLDSGLNVCILADNSAILSSQFHQAGLQVLATCASNLAPHGCATGEIDLSHGRVLDHSIDNVWGVLRTA
jgi:hypothetical protein